MYSNQGQRRIFDEPLSVQRYRYVMDYIAQDPNIQKVTDLGCGNGHIMLWLKTVPHLEWINFVDCDLEMLSRELFNYFRPNLIEMVFGRQNTDKALNIEVYNGDMAVPDDRLSADCFIMVEVLEHMELADVERNMETLFGYYQPKSVIITTPNKEFNHLLRSEGESANKFRHWDHKFEWTREEFVQWANGICQQYSYTVQFDGVGHLPNSEPYGPCTQIAVFKRQVDASSDSQLVQCDLLFNRMNVRNGDQEGMMKLHAFHLIGKRQPEPVENLAYDMDEEEEFEQEQEHENEQEYDHDCCPESEFLQPEPTEYWV